MENMRGRGRGRRGRGRGRGTAARRKKSIDRKDELLHTEEEEDDQPLVAAPVPVVESLNPIQLVPALDMEADISQLEAPTFTTLSRGPPEPMLRLSWGHPVNLLGEKVLNPMIHCCDTCLRPVLIYGRMIPCKHVFCLACAQRDCKQCPRCSDKVLRVEQTGLGTVFMCTHGGTRYGNTGCRRTYLSQRDLQAHINHRHVSGSISLVNPVPMQSNKIPEKPEIRIPPAVASVAPFYEAPKVKLFEEADLSYVPPRAPDAPPPCPPPMVRLPTPRAGNLITVPIQEPPPEPYFNAFNPPPGVPHGPPPLGHPPPTSQPPPYYSPFDYPPPDTSVPPPNQWPGNPPFYG